MKTITLLAALLVVSLALSSMVSAQTSVSYTDDLDGDRVPDAYDDDRDGDGVPNDRDAYPDDYTRSTLEDDYRNETTTTSSVPPASDDDGVSEDDLCGINTPWFWIIVGSLLIISSFVEKRLIKYRPILIILGIVSIIYGFSTWTAF
ncbi:MAG: hypothetical protein PHT77_10245 [Bacteroidales bacterium]|nr:hypothetical protein [Bacteroidales bacterium]